MTRAHARGTRRLDDTLDRVRLDNDAVLAKLLLDEDDLLRALDHEIPAGIERTLVLYREFPLILICQPALIAPQHDRDAPDADARSLHNLLAARILYRDKDLGRVRRIT